MEELLDDTIEILTRQMIEENFKSKDNKEKFIMTKEKLYQFSIKLIKTVKVVKNEIQRDDENIF